MLAEKIDWWEYYDENDIISHEGIKRLIYWLKKQEDNHHVEIDHKDCGDIANILKQLLYELELKEKNKQLAINKIIEGSETG